MQLITRLLDFLAALILEATVMYVDNTFDDVLTPNARFLAFVVVSSYTVWRALDLWELVTFPVRSLSRKMIGKLGLTVLGEMVFLGFFVREDR
jgi:hypothetical protein